MTISATGSDLWSYGQVGRLALQAGTLSGGVSALQDETATGLVDPSIAALGTATKTVLDLQPQVAQLAALQGNATVADDRLTAASTALASMSTMVQNLSTGLLGLAGNQGTLGTTSLAALSAQARSQLSTLGTLLNTKVGDAYVFAGEATTVAPIPDPSSLLDGPFATGVASAVAGAGTGNADDALQAIFDAAAGTASGATPFAASLAGAAPMRIPVATGETVEAGTSLTATGGATAGTSGSTIRDLVSELTTVASLSGADPTATGYSQLISALRSAVSRTETGIADLVGSNGVAQQQVAAATSFSSTLSDTLTSRIGDLTSVDLSSVSVQLTATQNQLQASYMLIKDLGSLTLTAYL